MSGAEGNGVVGAGWHLGGGLGQGLLAVLISAPWAGRCSARPLSVQLLLLLWSLHVLPGAGSSLLQQRERLAGMVRAIWIPGLACWQGSSGGLGRAGNGKPVLLGLRDESLLLHVQGGQSSSCSWFPVDACGGL